MGKLALDTVLKASKQLYPLVTAELSAQSSKKYNNDTFSLEELDNWRNVTLPELLKLRYLKKDLHVKKEELVLLMDWKLAKGKFRPTLPKLIKSNQDDDVVAITKAGLGIFMEFAHSNGATWDDVTLQEYLSVAKDSLKKLCELKGVGPATGSLLLSLLSATSALAPPFFSDEAFIYYIQEPIRPGTPIKYNVKEYIDEYLSTLFNIASQGPSITMNDLEKGGWALKMYDINHITKLADVKVPFEADDLLFAKFPDTNEYYSLPEPKKRKALEKTGKSQPNKRAKKN